MRRAPVQVPNHKSEEELGRSDESRECGRHIAVPKLRSAEAEANVNAIKVHTAPYGNGFGRLRNQPVQPQATIATGPMIKTARTIAATICAASMCSRPKLQ